VTTVAFEGVEARRVEVEVQLTGGAVHFAVVGLADKAVAESKERVRAAFTGSASPCPASGSSPTCRRPTCQRKATTSTCRSRSR